MKKILVVIGALSLLTMTPGLLMAQESSKEEENRYVELYKKYKEKLRSNPLVDKYVCGNSYSEKVEQKIASTTEDYCDAINTGAPTPEGNPYIYENNRSDCIINEFSKGDGKSLDACGILNMVTGGKVSDELNTLNKYGRKIKDGMSAAKNADIEGMMKATLGD